MHVLTNLIAQHTNTPPFANTLKFKVIRPRPGGDNNLVIKEV